MLYYSRSISGAYAPLSINCPKRHFWKRVHHRYTSTRRKDLEIDMNKKRRIVALIMAGLLTASLSACVTTQQRPPNPNGGTEEPQTKPQEQNKPSVVTWTTVDETVYVVASGITLVNVDNATDTTTARQLDALQRVSVGSNNQSIVVKDGKKYYAESKNLTNADLMGEGFQTCAKTTMYATETVRVRKYATSDYAFSTEITTLKANDTVTVVAKGGKWNKIEYVQNGQTNYYFVWAACLSESKVTDPNDLSQYGTVTPCDPVTKYVAVESVTLRKAPSVSADGLHWPVKDDQVTVIGTITVNGKLWTKVWVDVAPAEEGQSPVRKEGFIGPNCLSDSKGASSARTLEDMLAIYDTFTQTETPLTLYVVLDAEGKPNVTLNVRSSPDFPVNDKNEPANIVAALISGNSVKVVATGHKNETFWAMIEYKEGEYYFVSYSWLTPNPSGEKAPLTLAQLLATYPDFKGCAEKTVYAKSVVNCNSFPGNDDEPAKKLAANDAVTVVAEGNVLGLKWYIFRTADGAHYFAAASMFTEQAPTVG